MKNTGFNDSWPTKILLGFQTRLFSTSPIKMTNRGSFKLVVGVISGSNLNLRDSFSRSLESAALKSFLEL